MRCGRCYWTARPAPECHGGWFYQAREGVQGPFGTKQAAEHDLAQLIAAPPPRPPLHPGIFGFRNLRIALAHAMHAALAGPPLRGSRHRRGSSSRSLFIF